MTNIYELAEQAAEYAVLNPSDEVLQSETEDAKVEIPKAFIDKIAELIVKECLDLCEEVAVDADEVAKGEFVTNAGRMLHEGMWGGAKSCSGRIKEHFGVK